jgi:chromosome segregation ATPase
MLKLVWSSKYAAMKQEKEILQSQVDSLRKELEKCVSLVKMEQNERVNLVEQLNQTRDARDGARLDVKLLKEDLSHVKREHDKLTEKLKKDLAFAVAKKDECASHNKNLIKDLDSLAQANNGLKSLNNELTGNLEATANGYNRSMEIIQAQEEGMKKLNEIIARAVHLLNLNRGGRTSKRTLEAKQILEAHLKQSKDV